MATYSGILVQCTEEYGRLQSKGSQRTDMTERPSTHPHNSSELATRAARHKPSQEEYVRKVNTKRSSINHDTRGSEASDTCSDRIH